jgi:hypothetical protein
MLKVPATATWKRNPPCQVKISMQKRRHRQAIKELRGSVHKIYNDSDKAMTHKHTME